MPESSPGEDPTTILQVESREPAEQPAASNAARADAAAEPVQAPLSVPGVFDEQRGRYEIGPVLGQGATSVVYAALDRDLGREVAVKLVHSYGDFTTQRFVREARVTARLGHPNVPQVFDVGKSEDGFYLTMPRITGRSLRTLIRDAVASGATSALPPHELVEVMLKVCDAQAYAHAHGVVHQDIKPDNIMIGDYGNVMLVDWGAASLSGEPGEPNVVVGTPAYMAPEQVLGAKALPASDIYALGATLFHALLLRKPIDEPDQTLYFQRKVRGDLDVPTRDELSLRPRAIAAVAQRAMSLKPEQRYLSAGELGQALRDYLALGTAWSAPIVWESFRDESYRSRWQPDHEGFEVHDGWLVSQAALGALLYFGERLPAGVAIEFEAKMLPGNPAGDLSVLWTEDDVLQDGGARWPGRGKRTYCLQAGAFSNHLVGILYDFDKTLSTRSARLEPDRVYTIRAEIEERRLRLLIDGETVAEYEDRFPLRSGYLALYAYYPGKAFTNVRIQQRGSPAHLSPLAVGDAFFARNDFAEAELEYRRVEQGQAEQAVLGEAMYKRGLCLLKRGKTEAAFELWEALDGAEWSARIDLHRADVAFERGDYDDALEVFTRLWLSPAHHTAVIQRWCDHLRQLLDSDHAPLERYLSLAERTFGHEPTSRGPAARALVELGQYRRAIERFPEERLERCNALLALGRFDEVTAEHGDISQLRDMTRVRQGLFDQVSNDERFEPFKLLAMGRTREALRLSDNPEVLVGAGAYERVLASPTAGPLERVTALVRLGRLDEALATRHPLALIAADAGDAALDAAKTLSTRVRALHYLALRAFRSGDLDGFHSYRARVLALPFSYVWDDVWCDRFVLLPLALELSGTAGALASSVLELKDHYRDYWGQRAHYFALAALGEISDAAFLAQPCTASAGARLLLARAIRADAAREARRAADAYSELLLLPVLERNIDSVWLNPTLEQFVRGRLSALGSE